MKYILTAFCLIFLGMQLGVSQDDKSNRKSPPVVVSAEIEGAMITIDYSSPSAKGRTLWGGLVPYDEVWRTGANEATKFTTDRHITVEGKSLAPGTYSLFTIPGQESWTIIFNSVADQWGAYKYEAEKDVLRVDVTPVETKEHVEEMIFAIEDGGFSLCWGEIKVPVSVGILVD